MKYFRLTALVVVLTASLLALPACSGQKRTDLDSYLLSIKPEGLSLGKVLETDLDGDGKPEFVASFGRDLTSSITDGIIYFIRQEGSIFEHYQIASGPDIAINPQVIKLDNSKNTFLLFYYGVQKDGYSIYGLKAGHIFLAEEHRPPSTRNRTVFKSGGLYQVGEYIDCQDVQRHRISIDYAWDGSSFEKVRESISYPGRSGPYFSIQDPTQVAKGFIEASFLGIEKETSGYAGDSKVEAYPVLTHYTLNGAYEHGFNLHYDFLIKTKDLVVLQVYQYGKKGLYFALNPHERTWKIVDIADNLSTLGWEAYSSRDGKVTATYSGKLQASASDGGVYIFHSVPYVHDDPCDLSGLPKPPLPSLMDFNVFIYHHNRPFGDTIKQYGLQEHLLGNALTLQPGFIDSVAVGSMYGFRVTSQAEGCGIHQYFFKLVDGSTLYIERKIIPYFIPSAVGSYVEVYSSLPGVILPAEEESLFAALLSSVNVLPSIHPDFIADAKTLINKAFEITVGFYRVGCLNYAGMPVMLNGNAYYEVLDESFPTYSHFEQYIRSTYANDMAAQFLTDSKYVNHEGKLYTSSGEMGSFYNYGGFAISVLHKDSTSATIELRIPIHAMDDEDNPEDISIVKLVLVAGEWRISHQAFGW